MNANVLFGQQMFKECVACAMLSFEFQVYVAIKSFDS